MSTLYDILFGKRVPDDQGETEEQVDPRVDGSLWELVKEHMAPVWFGDSGGIVPPDSGPGLPGYNSNTAANPSGTWESDNQDTTGKQLDPRVDGSLWELVKDHLKTGNIGWGGEFIPPSSGPGLPGYSGDTAANPYARNSFPVSCAGSGRDFRADVASSGDQASPMSDEDLGQLLPDWLKTRNVGWGIDTIPQWPGNDLSGHNGDSAESPATSDSTFVKIEKGVGPKTGENVTSPQIAGEDNLGYLSGVGESNNDPGMISSGSGDKGGKSYGAFQFASKQGVPEKFINWLQGNSPEMYARLKDGWDADGGQAGTNFDAAWKEIANKDPDKFLNLQYNFTKREYFDNNAQNLKDELGFDINNRGYALKNVLWSRAVQHGGKGILSVMRNALNNVGVSNPTDEQLIKAIYDESGRAGDYGGDYITEDGIRAALNPTDAESETAFAREHDLVGKSLKYFDGSPDTLLGVWNRLNIEEPQKALELLKKHG